MKKLNPYNRQKKIQLVFAAVGAVGIATGLYFFFGNSDNSALISSSMYPFFVAAGVIQYIQLKNKYIHFSKEKIEWEFASHKETQKINLENAETIVESNWKGVVLKNNGKEYEISLDGIWKLDRKRIIMEMQAFYKAA